MTDQKTFGRRSIPWQQPLPGEQNRDLPELDTKPVVADVPAGRLSAMYNELSSPRVDAELRDSEQSVKQRFKMPWRQLVLMASLCFGVASFVLPDSLNDGLDWLLYGLMAVSAYVGFSKRIFPS
jgi:hypothetical protein